jgi:putative transcriptional regulator
MTKRAGLGRLDEAILETASGMRRLGIMDGATHGKITLRHPDDEADAATRPITGEEIRSIRERARMSQAVFARYLNLTVGYMPLMKHGLS